MRRFTQIESSLCHILCADDMTNFQFFILALLIQISCQNNCNTFSQQNHLELSRNYSRSAKLHLSTANIVFAYNKASCFVWFFLSSFYSPTRPLMHMLLGCTVQKWASSQVTFSVRYNISSYEFPVFHPFMQPNSVENEHFASSTKLILFACSFLLVKKSLTHSQKKKNSLNG